MDPSGSRCIWDMLGYKERRIFFQHFEDCLSEKFVSEKSESKKSVSEKYVPKKKES